MRSRNGSEGRAGETRQVGLPRGGGRRPPARGGEQRTTIIRPLIGLSGYAEPAAWGDWHTDAIVLHRSYVDRIVLAGGVPLLLPPAGRGPAAAAAVSAVAGLVLTGGADIDPARYRAAQDSRTTGVQQERDAWEAYLLGAALAADIPVLGICRGAQLLNIAHGGTLYQHLPDQVGHDGHRARPGKFADCAVTMDPELPPGSLLGSTAATRCSHHQAVDELGAGLVATAWHADGTIEAVCAPERRFVVGVQWHPEAGDDLRLFQGLVSAAQGGDRRAAGKASATADVRTRR